MNERIRLLLDILKEACTYDNRPINNAVLLVKRGYARHFSVGDDEAIENMRGKTDLHWALITGFRLGCAFMQWHVEQWAQGDGKCAGDDVDEGPLDGSCLKGEQGDECCEIR